ncbi:MAG: response regulator [Bacteroidota bacterium]
MIGGKLNVLIVEDNKINAIVLRKGIEKLCHVKWARNDTEAFAATAKEDFQLILMDINLGGDSLDGEAIMRKIKSDDRFADMHIYAVTSYAMPGDRERFIAAGFDEYFAKPIDKKALLRSIETLQGLRGTSS